MHRLQDLIRAPCDCIDIARAILHSASAHAATAVSSRCIADNKHIGSRTKLAEGSLATLRELADQLCGEAEHGDTADEQLVLLGEAELIANAQEALRVADQVDVLRVLDSACVREKGTSA